MIDRRSRCAPALSLLLILFAGSEAFSQNISSLESMQHLEELRDIFTSPGVRLGEITINPEAEERIQTLIVELADIAPEEGPKMGSHLELSLLHIASGDIVSYFEALISFRNASMALTANQRQQTNSLLIDLYGPPSGSPALSRGGGGSCSITCTGGECMIDCPPGTIPSCSCNILGLPICGCIPFGCMLMQRAAVPTLSECGLLTLVALIGAIGMIYAKQTMGKMWL